MTIRGRENEVVAFERMIDKFGHLPIFACVSDSYDIFNACTELWGTKLKDKILNMNATLVVRPDSGHAVETPVKCVQLLDEKFGHTLNSKSYKVLNKVRVIQGDGINTDDVNSILTMLDGLGYSADNIAFGMGGGLLQKGFDRDTNKFAFKCSSAVLGDKTVDVYKEPVTDAVKKSKRGKLDLILTDDGVRTVRYDGYRADSLMRLVYENGNILKTYTLEEVRANMAKGKLKRA